MSKNYIKTFSLNSKNSLNYIYTKKKGTPINVYIRPKNERNLNRFVHTKKDLVPDAFLKIERNQYGTGSFERFPSKHRNFFFRQPCYILRLGRLGIRSIPGRLYIYSQYIPRKILYGVLGEKSRIQKDIRLPIGT